MAARRPTSSAAPGGRRRRAEGQATRVSWGALLKLPLAVAVLTLAVTAVATPAPAAAPISLHGPVNGRIDQVEVLPDNGAAFGGATVEALAGVVGASGQIRLPVRDGLTASAGTATRSGSDVAADDNDEVDDGSAPDSTVRNESLTTPPGSSAEASTIPSRALAAYTSAADRVNAERPDCFLHWSLLAGIGAIESGHGKGAAIDPVTGQVTPTVVGPRLDGSAGMFYIRDTDDGWLDGDRELDRAVGPMQFTPAMWRWAGRDADADGRADPNDLDDATLAAAELLCASGDLRIPKNVLTAVRSYNPSEAYTRSVLGWAAWYAVGATVVSGLGAEPADATGGDTSDDQGAQGLPIDQPFEVTALTPLAGAEGEGCLTPVIDQGSISVDGVGGDVLTGSDHESLEVRGRVGGTDGRTVTIELVVLDSTGATVATGTSARTVSSGDEVVSLGRVDGLAIGRATGRGPFDVVVRVLPGGADCASTETRIRAADLDPADFTGAPPTLAGLRRHLETYRDTGRITRTAVDDLLATLPDGDGGLQAAVELSRFLDRLAAAIQVGEIAADARIGLGEVITALCAQVDPGSAATGSAATSSAAAPGAAGTGGDGSTLPFPVVSLAP
ncbi:murein transglycosylase [Frankia sp. CH37]|nr:murein transglycosylase [Parafrankia sp. CH37]